MASAQSHFYFNNTYLKSKPRSLGAFKEEYVVGMACSRCILRFPDNHRGSRPRAVSATHIGAYCWTGVYISLGWFLCYSFVLRWIRYFSEEGCLRGLLVIICRIVFYLLNLHIKSRHTYFARAGTSREEDSYKTDASLSEQGREHAKKMSETLIRHREGERRKYYRSVFHSSPPDLSSRCLLYFIIDLRIA